MSCALEILNNTFVGTLLAGLILTLVGFQLYRREKQIDIEFEDLKKARNTAAALYAVINSATGKIGGLFNMYDEKYEAFTKIRKHVGELLVNGLNQKVGKELEAHSTEVTALSENLTSQLTISNKFDAKVDIIAQNILTLNVYMQGASITIHKLKQEEISEWREGWDAARKAIVDELNKIMK